MSDDKIFEQLENFCLFPLLKNTKIPNSKHGFKDAHKGHSIMKLKRSNNIGLALKNSGLFVIDMDMDEKRGLNGIETIKKLEKELGKLPITLTQTTPRGGKHFIFRDKNITQPKGKIGKDVDLKYNGYIVVYPSKIGSKQYQFIDGFDENGQFIISELPKEWIKYINRENGNHYENAKSVAEHYVRTSQIMQNCDYSKIMNRCKFLQYCRDNAEILSEPMWFSMISVLAQISDSDQLIHELSKPYPRYSYRETQHRIDRARSFGHSQSCSYIRENFPECCKGCEQKKGEKQ